jgi:hypothetical protein
VYVFVYRYVYIKIPINTKLCVFELSYSYLRNYPSYCGMMITIPYIYKYIYIYMYVCIYTYLYPSDCVDRELAVIKGLGLTLKYAINTHVHDDHVSGSFHIKHLAHKCQSMISASSGDGRYIYICIYIHIYI